MMMLSVYEIISVISITKRSGPHPQNENLRYRLNSVIDVLLPNLRFQNTCSCGVS